ncbi:MAG: serine/threonine protein kinase [Polyangiaceae bacterium]
MADEAPIRIGRYVLYAGLGTGSTSTVHFALEEGADFARLVAVKRFVANLASSAEFVAELSAEVQQVARARHLNIVPVREIVSDVGECIIAMDYVPGETLANLLQACAERTAPAPSPEVVCAIVRDMLQGLQAMHEARDAEGATLDLVHGDASPSNVLVGTDGFSRMLDFGVAHALGDLSLLQRDHVRLKLAYTSPERLESGKVDARADLFAVAVTMWESLVARKLFMSSDVATTLERVASAPIQRPSELALGIPPALDDVVMRGLERDPSLRFSSAKEMLVALKAALKPASLADVETWMKDLAGNALADRARMAKEIEELGKNVAPEEAPPSSFSAEDLPPPPSSHHREGAVDVPADLPPPPPSHRELQMPASLGTPLTGPAMSPVIHEAAPAAFEPTSFLSQAEAQFGPMSTATKIALSSIKELPPPMRDRKPEAGLTGRRKIVVGALIVLAMYGAAYYLVFMDRAPKQDALPPLASVTSASGAPPIPAAPTVDPFDEVANPIPADSTAVAPPRPKPRAGRAHLKKCDPPYVQDMSGKKVPNTSCN